MYNYFDFKKSKCLFGEQFVRKDKLIICEGPIDAISIWQKIKNTDYDVVALMGSIISKDQLSAVLNLTKEVYLFMDNDAVGLSSTMKNGKQLMGRILTHYVEYNQDEFGEDPNSLIQKNINIIDRLESASVINTSWNG
jgi:DNA primase